MLLVLAGSCCLQPSNLLYHRPVKVKLCKMDPLKLSWTFLDWHHGGRASLLPPLWTPMQSPKAKTMTGLTWLATMALVGFVSGSIVSDNEITDIEVEPDPPESYNFSLVSNVTLPCLGHDGNAPLAWITPSQLVVKDQESFYVTLDVNGTCVREPETGNHVGLAENGSLKLIGLGWRDQGTYRCLWQDPWPLEDDNDGQATNMSEYRVAILIDGIDQRRHTYHISLIYGFATAGGFLLLTLLSKLVYFLLETWVKQDMWCVSSMIHSDRPTVPLFLMECCFVWEIGKVGTYVQTDRHHVRI